MKNCRLGPALASGPAVAAGVVLTVSTAVPASAAAPANQACLGKDVSTYARWDGAHGGLVSSLAHANGGMGKLVQTHQAGLLPDSVIENSCDD
jgi:hypothetical protein